MEDFFKAERVSITNEEAYIWDAVMDFDNNRNGFNTLVALAEQNMPLTDEVLDEQHTYTPENVVGAKSFMEFIQFVRANDPQPPSKHMIITTYSVSDSICELDNKGQSSLRYRQTE